MNSAELTKSEQESSARKGFFFALGAYSIWGVLPLYFKVLEHISALELLAHRVIWAVPIALFFIRMQNRLGELKGLFKDKRIVAMMALTACLISINWGVFVWAISANITSQTALGYFITPLITILLGYALLGEKLTGLQIVAVSIAVCAVLVKTIAGGVFPYVSLIVACSFAAYGYFRKTVAVGPAQGFLMEVVLLFPFAVAYAVWLGVQDAGHFTFSNNEAYWLMLAGPFTALPLIFYSFGAKLLRLTTLGLMQYLAPTTIFLIAVFIFNEEIDIWSWIAFAMIWFALALYSWSIWRIGKTSETAIP